MNNLRSKLSNLKNACHIFRHYLCLTMILHTKASQTRSCDMILPVATHSLKR